METCGEIHLCPNEEERQLRLAHATLAPRMQAAALWFYVGSIVNMNLADVPTETGRKRWSLSPGYSIISFPITKKFGWLGSHCSESEAESEGQNLTGPKLLNVETVLPDWNERKLLGIEEKCAESLKSQGGSNPSTRLPDNAGVLIFTRWDLENFRVILSGKSDTHAIYQKIIRQRWNLKISFNIIQMLTAMWQEFD